MDNEEHLVQCVLCNKRFIVPETVLIIMLSDILEKELTGKPVNKEILSPYHKCVKLN